MRKLNDDERFRNVNYQHTDVAARFRREIARLKAEAEAKKREAESAPRVVRLKEKAR